MAEPKPSAYQEAQAKYGNLTGIERRDLEDALGGLQFYFRDYYNSEGDQIQGARGRYQENVREMMAAAPESVRNYIQATNEGRMLDMLNNQQFYADDVLPSDAAAREAVIYSGKVPYGYADRETLGSGVLGASIEENNSKKYGAESVPEEIFFGGKRVGENTPVHEGYHLATNPRYKEEKGVRGLDYYRAKLTNDAGAANTARQFLLNKYGMDIREPRDLGELRMNTLRQVMSIRPEYYEGLPEEAKDRYRKALEGRMESGIIAELFNREPSFNDEGFVFSELGNMPEEQFIEMLKDAPAFEAGGSYDYLTYEGPRMVPDGDTMVRGYGDGGGVQPPQDDLFPETIKEGIGTLVEYAPKIAKVAGRGIGDLVRSEMVSPPELATAEGMPEELTPFELETQVVPEDQVMNAVKNIGEKLYSPDVLDTLSDDALERMFFGGQPGMPKQAGMVSDLNRSFTSLRERLNYEQSDPRIRTQERLNEARVKSEILNYLLGELDPKVIEQLGPEGLGKMVKDAVETTRPVRKADGGVISLKDRAVNMTRGPRGIEGFVPFLGA